MTMMESEIPHPLETIFRSFEKRTGWRISPQARIILQEGYNAVGTDTLGLGIFAQPSLRSAASEKVVELMPTFLETVRSKAETREKSETKNRMIGGVFILQNTDAWRLLFGCTCWPM